MAILSTTYNPKDTEDKWYAHWMEKNYFHSEPDEREPYTIVIPPPNVTGVLHMGHLLNNTIQDILIRKARLEGKNACWVPGTDHASIATEAKVVNKLREEKGIKKADLTRDEFMKHAWEWTDEYGGIILNQLKKLGASCDWDRTRFTLEESLSKAVAKVFVDLYKKGKIFRGKRMTNWDPEAKTVLSNEEVVHSDERSKLYHIRYQIEGTEEYLTIATTRPETILGDSAIAVNPKDERYQHLKGKRAIVPMVNRSVPIIFDRYVEMDFGTGALKVTPAHDMNDYEIGERHNLEVIEILNDDGTLSETAQFYIGEDRFIVRKKIAKELKALGHLVDVEDYTNKVGRSERTKAVIEPRLTEQWFLDMTDFAASALKAVEDGEVNFLPPHFFNMYQNWLKADNVRHWCISRQLWWGHRIPAWYCEGEFFVAETIEEALEQAKAKTGNANLTTADLKQDEDALDTWFSSWLWPISVFDGFERQDELEYYYPTNVLVTGWDIMFFWVARMIMAGYEWSEDLIPAKTAKAGKMPFKDVYFTGMVRDNQRRKMSKSLGNSPDALALLDKYGADGVRFGLLSSAAAGNDIVFDAPTDPKTKKAMNESKLCLQGMQFCNKMWNALRLVKGWEITEEAVSPESEKINQLAIEWIQQKLQKVLAENEEAYKTYRLSEVTMNLRAFIWDDFCSWYLEMIKPEYGKPIDRKTLETTIAIFEQLVIILHPIMPFITEEIWHLLKDRKEGEDCIVASYPATQSFDADLISTIDSLQDIVSKVREVRQKNGLKKAELLKAFAQSSDKLKGFFQLEGYAEMLNKMAVLESCTFVNEEPPSTVNFLSGTEKFYIELHIEIDTEAELAKLKADLNYQQGFLRSVDKKLSNERFVNNAPAPVIEKERQKQADALAKIAAIQESMKKLGA